MKVHKTRQAPWALCEMGIDPYRRKWNRKLSYIWRKVTCEKCKKLRGK